MAKKSRQDQLFEALRARGLRKSVARNVSKAAGRSGGGKTPKVVRDALGDLRSAVSEIEGRVTGRSPKRKAAAEKAARTRKRNAAKRSTAAKKGAQTRAKRGTQTRTKARS